MKSKNITKLPLLAAFSLFSLTTNAAPVDLSGWTAEGGSSSWNVQAPSNDTVLQTVNGNPTVFFDPSATSSQGTALSGKIQVTTTGDDDFIGFVLGYNSGELTSGSGAADGASTTGSDFFLIDWKQANQSGALAGLAISHVTGAGTSVDFWTHTNSVNEISRATNLGSTGWLDNTEYSFDILFTSSLIQVSVDNVLELSITAADASLTSFSDGAFGFYNYSQSNVLYSAITQVNCSQTPNAPGCQQGNNVPEPASLALLSLGLVSFGFRKKLTKT